MTKGSRPKSPIRVVYRRSSALTKTVVLAAVVLSMTALLTMGVAIQDAQARTEALQLEAAALEQENARLERYIDELGSVQSVRRIAREQLGLIDPGTIVFQPE